jgi:hypothetical protein
MTDAPHSFDPIWEDKYAHGHAQRYPWDTIVKFVFCNVQSERLCEQVRILEVGCVTASNLWLSAREGILVSGVGVSSNAITTDTRQPDQQTQVGLRVTAERMA